MLGMICEKGLIDDFYPMDDIGHIHDFHYLPTHLMAVEELMMCYQPVVLPARWNGHNRGFLPLNRPLVLYEKGILDDLGFNKRSRSYTQFPTKTCPMIPVEEIILGGSSSLCSMLSKKGLKEDLGIIDDIGLIIHTQPAL